MKRWTTKDLAYIREHLYLSDVQLAANIGVTISQLKGARKRHGIKREGDGRFKPGHKTWNKGVRWQENLAPEKAANIKRAQFKKGSKPVNHNREMYAVFVQDGYKFIKLPHRRAYPLGRYVWEQSTGQQLGKHDVITYKDKNPLNCDISNLLKITRKENALRNVNREKAAKSLARTWRIHKALKAYGVESKYKWKAA